MAQRAPCSQQFKTVIRHRTVSPVNVTVPAGEVLWLPGHQLGNAVGRCTHHCRHRSRHVDSSGPIPAPLRARRVPGLRLPCLATR
jgi:hypothetical protein